MDSDNLNNTNADKLFAAWHLWQVQESLLQQYRFGHLIIQAIFFAHFCGGIADGNTSTWIALIAAGLILAVQFKKIVASRGRDVSFCQRLVQLLEEGKLSGYQVMIEFKRYQSLGEDYTYWVWRLKEDTVFTDFQRSKTRVSLDTYLIFAIQIFWLLAFVKIGLDLLAR